LGRQQQALEEIYPRMPWPYAPLSGARAAPWDVLHGMSEEMLVLIHPPRPAFLENAATNLRLDHSQPDLVSQVPLGTLLEAKAESILILGLVRLYQGTLLPERIAQAKP